MWRALKTPSELAALKVDPHKELDVVGLLEEGEELAQTIVGGRCGLRLRIVVHDLVEVLEHPLDP